MVMDGRCRCSGNSGDDRWRGPASLSSSGRVRRDKRDERPPHTPHITAQPHWTGLKSSSSTPPSSPVRLPSVVQEASTSVRSTCCSACLGAKEGRRPGFQHPDAAKVCAQAGHHLCLLWPMKLQEALLGMLDCWWECVAFRLLLWPGRSLTNGTIKDECERREGGQKRGPPHTSKPVPLASLVV